MKQVRNRIATIIALLMLSGSIISSCKTTAREEKFYERQEKKQAADAQKEYDLKVKEHREMQSKETLNMMKDAEKRSRKLNKSRRR